MYLTVKQQVKHLSKQDYITLRDLCHTAKNLANEAIYNVRQHYFQTGKYLSYSENYKLLKNSVNYKTLNSNMSQQILKEVDGMFKSFFGLLKLAKKGQYNYNDIKLPHYLPKGSFMTLVIGFVRLDDNKLVLPYSNSFKKTHGLIQFNVPPVLNGRKIKEVRIIPKADARFFEIQYTYEAVCTQRNLNKNNVLALDLGVDNLVTAVTNTGETFIIDGRYLKSVNQWYNKKLAKLQCIKDKQHLSKRPTKRQSLLTRKRNNRINDYISKTARYIVDYCINNDIGILVAGNNTDFQHKTNMGTVNNQTFVNIPYGRLLTKLEYLCELNGITFIRQEESYTSKASFWDNDDIPVYNKDNTKEYTFSGKRIHRGLYRTSDDRLLNADINGALNILRKSSVVSLTALYSRGVVNTPVRIRVV